MKKVLIIFTSLLLLVLGACSSQSSDSGEDSGSGGKEKSNFPTKNITLVAPATPGGGWDTTARSMKKVLKGKKLVEKPISVINKPGGSGEVGWKYLEKQDGHTLAINSSLVITNHLLGHSELTYKQFTPIAILTTEWMALVVPSDSKFESGKALLEQLKKDPKSVKIAIAPGLGNDAHLSFVEACNTFGVDVSQINFLIYGSGGDQVQALVGNHVDAAMMSVSEIKQQYKAGKVDILAVTSGERLSDLKDVPTWKEQGIDVVFPHWRGVMGPPDMSQAAIDFWDKKIGKMVKTDAWKEVLANNQWESFYKDSSETKKFLKAQVEKYQELVKSAGLVK
ncbi:MAG TPA: tripartite tricarboxylate transporter substrate binding protein [Bacillales bacterium]|nr:tripartite tricarboxylate transporter substrate binding protein [Bacillales bacterium]